MTVLPVTTIALGGNSLSAQIGGGARRRGEMAASQAADQRAVHLLGKGAVPVVGAQARLDVTEAHLAVERRQRAREHGRRIALRQNEIGRCRGQHPIERRQQPRGQLRQGLVVRHHIEVDVRPDVEIGEDLVEHFAMLRGGGDGDRKAGRVRSERRHHRRHLDRLGPGADHAQDVAAKPHSSSGTVAAMRLPSAARRPGHQVAGGLSHPPMPTATQTARPPRHPQAATL